MSVKRTPWFGLRNRPNTELDPLKLLEEMIEKAQHPVKHHHHGSWRKYANPTRPNKEESKVRRKMAAKSRKINRRH